VVALLRGWHAWDVGLMATTWTVPARVVRVVDGDTLIMDLDLGWKTWRLAERCRLAGINCPEMDTPEGVVARDFVHQLLHWLPEDHDGQPVVTFTSHSLDKYGRPLGHVRLADGRILNTLILDAGHAVPM
jgi:micrococcal nuclease